MLKKSIPADVLADPEIQRHTERVLALREEEQQTREKLGGLIAAIGAEFIAVKEALDRLYAKTARLRWLKDHVHYSVDTAERYMEADRGQAISVAQAAERMKGVFVFALFAAGIAGCASPGAHPPSPRFAGGIGARVCESNGVAVLQVARGMPAEKAGIMAGDKIVEVDGMPTLGLRVREAVLLLRGPAGSKTTLLVRSAGCPEPRSVTLVREAFDPQNLKWNTEAPPGAASHGNGRSAGEQPPSGSR